MRWRSRRRRIRGEGGVDEVGEGVDGGREGGDGGGEEEYYHLAANCN